ncbi:hypothetical protein PR048_027759 [Dryococelus australis]|uniref:Uncharacterized protein n=1 Tax=Dryococelus australis TaxID=614101 RepID=A0ABQ9GHD0_9NEOP|nr:hypothetical protein PR048_027759 [Dryococelus australis]
MKNAHDRTARRQEVKSVQGEEVVVRTGHCDIWKPGVIVEKPFSPFVLVLMEVDYETKPEGDEFHVSSEQLRQFPCSSPSEPDFRGLEPSMSAADECNTTRSGRVVKPKEGVVDVICVPELATSHRVGSLAGGSP